MKKPDADIMCPYTAFARSCRDIVGAHTCPKYVHVLGKNPQTNAEVDHWGCIDSMQHLLMIENSQMQRQTGAAIESFRNEVVARQLPLEDHPQLPLTMPRQISRN